MEYQEQIIYSVEYEMSGVIFYKNLLAFSFDDAKRLIQQQYPHVHVRAVSIIDNSYHTEEEEIGRKKN